jgi:isocitrate lyase
MFKLDQQFLEELGLDQLPDDQKQAFLDHIYSQLELRVGTRLSDGLSEDQLSEFESFIDRDDEKVSAWIATNAPDYTTDPAFVQLREGAPGGTTESVLLAEYASLRWLAMNRPDYRDVVKQVLDEIKQEILSNRDAIIGS